MSLSEPEVLHITNYGVPVPKARPRFNAHSGVTYTPRRTLDAEELLAWWLKMNWKRPPDSVSTFHVSAVFYTATPKTRGDVDNYLKLVLDAGNEIIWQDDRQVTVASGERQVDRERPRTEITIRRLSPQLPPGEKEPS